MSFHAVRFCRLAEALAFACILTFARMIAALAGALPLAGIGADTMAHRIIRQNSRRDDRIGKHQGGGCCRDRRTGFCTKLHDVSLFDSDLPRLVAGFIAGHAERYGQPATAVTAGRKLFALMGA